MGYVSSVDYEFWRLGLSVTYSILLIALKDCVLLMNGLLQSVLQTADDMSIDE